MFICCYAYFLFILFCFSFFMYFDIIGNIFNDTIFALPLNNHWEKDVQLSVPMSNIMDLMVSGVPCARSRC